MENHFGRLEYKSMSVAHVYTLLMALWCFMLEHYWSVHAFEFRKWNLDVENPN